MTTTSKSVANYLYEKNIISSDDFELYEYGLGICFNYLLSFGVVLIISTFFGLIWQSALFMLGFVPLRVYAGGYHAKTKGACFCLSAAVVVVFMLVIKFVPFNSVIFPIVLFASVVAVALLSPVECENKRLNNAEVKAYGKRTRIILTFEVAVVLLLYITGAEVAEYSMGLSIILCAALVVVGRIQNIKDH